MRLMKIDRASGLSHARLIDFAHCILVLCI